MWAGSVVPLGSVTVVAQNLESFGVPVRAKPIIKRVRRNVSSVGPGFYLPAVFAAIAVYVIDGQKFNGVLSAAVAQRTICLDHFFPKRSARIALALSRLS